MIEEVPELGLSIDETARVPKIGQILENCVAVKTIPYKTDREFLLELSENPTLSVLEFPEDSADLGKELEKQGLLPRGITDRSLARYYDEQHRIAIKITNKYKGRESERWKERADRWKKRLTELGADPISNEEAKELMIKVIREEYNKKLGL